MAAPTYIGKTNFGSSINSVSVDFSSLSAGTVQAGDLLVIAVEQANQPISSITGFTKVSPDRGSGTAGAASAVGIQIFYKLIASGSESSVTVGDAGDHTTAIGFVFRPDTGQVLKLDTSDGTDSQSIASAGDISLAGVTTTANDGLIFLACGSDRDGGASTNFGTVTNANLTSLTERHDQTVTAGNGGGIGVWSGIMATAGATGTTTVVNNGGATILFAVMTAAFVYDVAAVVGRADETDTSLALSQTQIRTAGLSNDTETALALGFPVPTGRADETDSAFNLSYIQGYLPGMSTEADTAFNLSVIQIRSAGQASETDTAIALNPLAVLGIATESDSALTLTLHQIVTVKLTTLGTGLSWLLPADCDTSIDITGYAIGGGGGGEDGVTSNRSGAGGGGGEVVPIDFSVSGLTRGVSTIPYRIGAGGIAAGIPAGGDTWINKAGASAPSSGTDGALAKGGGGGSTGTGGAGGTGGVSPGTKIPGGAGGDGVSSFGSSSPGGGGGGAAGGGSGGISTSAFGAYRGGGGGGGTLPQDGGTSSTSAGGTGGAGSTGGAGGAGGDVVVSDGSAKHGRAGTDGTNWPISLGGSVGPGGGSGGGAGGPWPGGSNLAGLYGGGGGGGGCTTFGTSGFGQEGAQGVIVLTYFTVPPGTADPVGRSNETDTAQALSAKQVRATGLSTETDTSRVLGLGLQLGRSTETDTALPAGIAYPVGRAAETDVSFSLSTVYDYVIDGLNGNDSNAGTPAAPWASLNKINTIVLSAGALIRVLVKNTATYSKVGDYLLRNGTGGQPGAGSTLEIYFESGVVMDGTLCNAVAPTAGAEFDGNNAHSTKLIGLALLGLGGPIIQNYNSTSGGASPNGIGNRGLNTLDVYNFRVTACIDGFSAHETAVLRTHDCRADDCSKSAFAHIDSSQFFAYRSSFYGKSGATLGIGAILNSASGYFENCNFIPATSEQALALNNTTTLRCRIGTLTTSVELTQTVTVQTATDCFFNVFIDGNAKLTARRPYGKFSTRCRSGGAIDVQHHIFSGPATSQSSIIFSSGSGLGSSKLIFKNGIVETATAAEFMAVNATYAGNMVAAASELDHNILSGSAAFDSDYTTAAGGTPTGTVSADALIGAANTTAMADYAFAAGSPAIGAASDSSDCGFGTSQIVSVGVPEAYALGISAETDASLALGKVYLLSASLSQELSTAFSLDDLAGGPAGLSLETDSAFDLAKKFTLSLGLSVETDTAIVLERKQILLTSIATETDTAFELAFASRFEVGRAEEIDAALALDAKLRSRKPGRSPLRYRPRPKSRYRY